MSYPPDSSRIIAFRQRSPSEPLRQEMPDNAAMRPPGVLAGDEWKENQRRRGQQHKPRSISYVTDQARFESAQRQGAMDLKEALDLPSPSAKEYSGALRQKRHASKSFSDASSGIRQMVRRASTSMRTTFSHGASNHDPTKFQTSALERRRALTSTFPKTLFGDRWVSRLRSSRSRHFMSESLPEVDHLTARPAKTSYPTNPAPNAVVPGRGTEPPILSGNPYQGQAARAAAAAQNEKLHVATVQTPPLSRNDSFASRSSVKWGMPRVPTELPQDAESAVHLVGCSDEEGQNETWCIDPVRRLPLDIAQMIFSDFDVGTLASAYKVSKLWYSVAQTNAVWRNIFLRRYRYASSRIAAMQNGGAGLGPSNHSGNDWREMYRIREQLNRHWKTRQVATVYFTGHTDSVYCLQFDEDKLITGSRDRTVRVWDLHTYECRKIIGGPTSEKPPNHERLHLLRKHGSVVADRRAVPANSKEKIYHIPHVYHSASILCLQYDEEIMVTGSSDWTCIVWNIQTFQPIRRLYGHTQGVLDLCFNNKYIISCSKDCSIRVWDRKSGECVKLLRGHAGPVNAIQLRGNLLVSASGDGVCKLWNIEDGVPTREFRSNDRGLACVEFSDDGKYVFAGGNDHVVYKFDANTGQAVGTFRGHTGLVRSLYFDGANKRLITGSYDQSIKVFNMVTKRQIAEFPEWTTSWILSAKSDYRRIVGTSQDGRAILLDFGWTIPGIETLENR